MSTNLKVAAAQLNPVMGDFAGNVELARGALDQARKANADLVVFPELFITGYPPEDLVLRPAFQAAARNAVLEIAVLTKDGPAALVGTPWLEGDALYNAVVLLERGEVRACRYKVDLPNYGVFDEKRVFATGPMPGPIEFKGVRLGVPICEDIWSPDVPECLMETGAEALIVINGSPYAVGKADLRMNVAVARVKETGLPLLYVNQVGGQDELVFDGASFALNADLKLQSQFPSFEPCVDLMTLERASAGWTVSSNVMARERSEDEAVYKAAVIGLRDYVNKNGFKGVLFGLSGGIDSALCAAISVDALGPERVRGVMLPFHYTSRESLDDAGLCADRLGIRLDELPIAAAFDGVKASLSPLMPEGIGGITEENIQSRLRGLLLMALSNKEGEMLVTTGNKSEVSVGYATLYGDMNGGFNPIKDLYKTRVYDLSRFRNKNVPEGCLGPSGEVIPENIITKAPTAELRDNQTDQDSLPPYEVLDDILYSLVEADMPIDEIVKRGHERGLVERVEHLLYLAEYKRRQAAPGVKITLKNFGRDRRYPITNKYRDR